MPIEVFARKIGIDKKEQQWIIDNDKEDHYYNNSALKNDWLSLSYPVYDGDYYFAFINDSKRVSAQQNAKMNRELRRLAGSKLNAEQIYQAMYKYGQMHAKNSGLGDTMTREEIWRACVDIRKKNPVKESIEEAKMTMKQIMRKHGSHLKKAQKSGNLELPSKVEKDLQNWVFDNEPSIGDDPDDFDNWLDNNIDDIVKGRIREDINVMDTYRKMWKEAGDLNEEVANITVDPKNRINSGQQQAYHGMEIAKQARRFGLKSAVMHKHIRIKGPKKKVNDFLRLVIGKSTYGDPTEKDMSTPQVDKMLTKGLK